MVMKSAVVLLSGGLDSATLLYHTLEKGLKAHCLTFAYGQRHVKEIQIARGLARQVQCPCHVVHLSLPWLSDQKAKEPSSLTNKKLALPQQRKIHAHAIPSTYVPGRNIVFLSLAVSFAETIGARDIFIGANAIDYSGYPDCRPNFFKAYQSAADKGSKAGVEGHRIKIHAPFVRMSKAQIIKLGFKLGVPYQKTWSCYKGSFKPCGVCDSCVLRQRGFEAIHRHDPLLEKR
jgi:7-cyano-7-deazaguanine synthase